MTYLAGGLPRHRLGTAAVIVPWHDPLRVAEQAAVLDCCAKAGCGSVRPRLARREFAAFHGTMDKSRTALRGRADDRQRVRTGFIEGHGKIIRSRGSKSAASQIQFYGPHL